MRKDVLAELGAALLTAKTSHVPRCAAQRLTSVQAAADAAYTALLRGTLETAGGAAADRRSRCVARRRPRAARAPCTRVPHGAEGAAQCRAGRGGGVESQLLTSFLADASIYVLFFAVLSFVFILYF